MKYVKSRMDQMEKNGEGGCDRVKAQLGIAWTSQRYRSTIHLMRVG